MDAIILFPLCPLYFCGFVLLSEYYALLQRQLCFSSRWSNLCECPLFTIYFSKVLEGYELLNALKFVLEEYHMTWSSVCVSEGIRMFLYIFWSHQVIFVQVIIPISNTMLFIAILWSTLQSWSELLLDLVESFRLNEVWLKYPILMVLNILWN